MKKLLFITILSLLFKLPAYGQDEIEDLLSKYENALNYVTDIETKYTTTVVHIRREPSTDAEIIDNSMIGSAFEVVVIIDDWAMITTEDGYAYMKADWFVDDLSEIPKYTEEDLYILAHVICGEAQGYSDEEQQYVASVVLNRVNHPSFPNTIETVVFQKRQYSCVGDGNYYRTPTERNWENAKYILENGSVLPGDVVFQSGGKQGSGVYLKTDKHYYCYY